KERLSTTIFIAAAGLPFNSVPENTLPIASVTPSEATVPRSSKINSSKGSSCSNDFIFDAHTSACCIAACAVGGNGRPASSRSEERRVGKEWEFKKYELL